ncbi:hypothetical protein JCM8097_005382 [Rhodosporidiobolus ruineniae]
MGTQSRPASSSQPPRRRSLPWSIWLSIALSLPLLAHANPAPPEAPHHLSRRARTAPGVLYAGDYVCRLEGDCAPCPPYELSTPVCKLYGNRRALSCIPRRNGKPVEPSYRTNSTTTPSYYRADPVREDEEILGPSELGLDDDDGEEGYDAAPGSGSGRGGGALGGGREEAGRLRGDTEAEEELKLAAGEVAAELGRTGSAGGGGGGGPSAEEELADVLADEGRVPARRRRRRFVVDAEEYERVERRQGGVQLKTQAWEACPKVLKAEREDFFEYILCNAFFALLGLSVLAYRQRTLALRQFGRLAARIMQTEVVG